MNTTHPDIQEVVYTLGSTGVRIEVVAIDDKGNPNFQIPVTRENGIGLTFDSAGELTDFFGFRGSQIINRRDILRIVQDATTAINDELRVFH